MTGFFTNTLTILKYEQSDSNWLNFADLLKLMPFNIAKSELGVTAPVVKLILGELMLDNTYGLTLGIKMKKWC